MKKVLLITLALCSINLFATSQKQVDREYQTACYQKEIQCPLSSDYVLSVLVGSEAFFWNGKGFTKSLNKALHFKSLVLANRHVNEVQKELDKVTQSRNYGVLVLDYNN